MISPIKFLKLQQVLHIHIAFYRKGKIRSRRLKLILFSDDQNENFTFVVLDSDGLTFRFGYCRRSNRESTCLCLIRYEYKINSLPDCCYFFSWYSYYPWFEVFYNILNDLSQIINSKSVSCIQSLYYSIIDFYSRRQMSNDSFHHCTIIN
jgi:hypothetical protein